MSKFQLFMFAKMCWSMFIGRWQACTHTFIQSSDQDILRSEKYMYIPHYDELIMSDPTGVDE